MSDSSTINRRSFLSSGASLVAAGASFMIVPTGYALSGSGSDSEPMRIQGGHHMDEEMQKCIQLCEDCHAICTQTIAHCLNLGGRHAAPESIRALLDCAQMCTTTVDYMLRKSAFHDRICRVCSELCTQCANDCEQVAGKDPMITQCIDMCRTCAESCKRMASKAAA